MVVPTETLFLNATFFIVSLSVIFITYIKWAQCYWSRRKVTTLNSSFFFGNIKPIFFQLESFGENLRALYMDLKGKGLSYCGYYMFFNPIWVVLDVNLVKQILTKDFLYFTDRCIYINEKNDPLTDQLMMQKGKKWKTCRTKLTPTFTPGKIREMFPILLNCSDELIKVVSQNKLINFKETAARYTTDVIGSCAFGVDCNTLKGLNSELRRHARMAFENSTIQTIKHFVAFTCPWIMDTLKLPLFPPRVIDYFMKMVRQIVDYRETNNIVRKDFMHLLIQLKNNGTTNTKDGTHTDNFSKEDTLTIEEITAQAFLFLIGGFETSSTALSFCLCEVSKNPEIQKRLRQEVLSVDKKYNGKLTYESLAEMSFMENCIEETLRKYPPMPVLPRECTKNYKVPGTDLEIQKGTRVFIPVIGIQYDSEYYPEPEVFDPDRFTNENKTKRHPFAWLPFGEGPRGCIAMRFGMAQIKVALAGLVKNYKFSLNERTVLPLELDTKNFMLSTKNGIWLNVENID